MSTALDLIKRAYRLIGVYAIGETPSADETADGLAALNQMLEGWSNEKLMVYQASLDAITTVPGQASYTVGPTGDTVSVRPQDIDSSSNIVYGSVTYPLAVATLQEYNSIKLKTLQTTLPSVLRYTPDYPNGTVTLYPIPTLAMTLNLWSWKPLTGFVSATDTVSLPPGYAKAIAYNLAIELAPENEVSPSPVVVKGAVTSKKLIKRTNFEPVVLSMPGNIPAGGRFNIYTGLPA
jgi:hypothetical protein